LGYIESIPASELVMLWPVMVLITTIALILIGSVAVSRETSRRLLPFVGIAGAGIACLASVMMAVRMSDVAAKLMVLPVVFDSLSSFVAIVVSFLLMGIILLSVLLRRGELIEWPVYLVLLVGSGVGMILLASTVHLVMFIISVEVASLSSYVLVGFRRNDRKAAEGATKYVIFGAVCSGLMVYGISLLFGLFGTFDFGTIAAKLAREGGGLAGLVGLGCLFIGLGFKISLVPMHFWCPDAFEAAGSEVAAWLSVGSKSAGLVALARFSHLLGGAGSEVQGYVYWAIVVCALATMTLGNFSAYWQSSVKRLLAYSSIAHAGYMACGVAILSGTAGIGAVVAYVFVYMLMNFGAFAVAGVVERFSGSDDISQFRELGRRSPAVAVFMMIFLFSLVGLPPLAGFAAKWILLSELWQAEMILLVVFILANTVISLFYYMRIARAMYFERSDLPRLKPGGGLVAVLAGCAGLLLVVFVGWGLLSECGKFLAGRMLLG